MRIVTVLFCLLMLPLPVLAAEMANLSVPHIWEIPNGAWVPPWSGACEEASMMMVERYYLGNRGVSYSNTEMQLIMQPLFAIEDHLFGSNSDTNSTRTLKVINDFTSFDATSKQNPSLDDIKSELRRGHPVISLHYGYSLNNPLHRFRRGGSSYHMMVITGFDEDKKEFLVNDPELKNGLDFRYPYDIILGSLHDFNHATKKADGPPVVLFTKSKQIVRGAGRRKIFVVRDNTKYLITNPTVFTNHRWSWKLVREVDIKWLDSLPSGESINQ